MSRRRFGLVFVAALAGAGCGRKGEGEKRAPHPGQATPPSEAPATKPPYDPMQLAVFAPLPATLERPDNPITDDKVALGRRLFFDTRLSRGQDVSCASCHDVAKAGADDKPLSVGTKGRTTRLNTPTVFNAAGAFAQGWDARFATVEDLVVPHVVAADIMGMADEKHLVDVVTSIPGYAGDIKKAFPGEKSVTADAISKALGAYVRRLVTPARWDRFLLGEEGALDADEKAGLGVFLDAGCATCHAGKLVGAAMSQKLGLAKPWPPDAGTDPGRYAVTNQDVDRGVFKVPSLRNVTNTAPYLHDGSVSSLAEMTKLMAHHETGRDLDDAQAKSLVTFLGALAGEAPKDLIFRPELPPSGPKTPKAE